MTKPWELTPRELGADTHIARGHHRAIATTAVKKYQEWLASQCGPDPCRNDNCSTEAEECSVKRDCPDYQYWLGQQQGYAKGLQERGK